MEATPERDQTPEDQDETVAQPTIITLIPVAQEEIPTMPEMSQPNETNNNTIVTNAVVINTDGSAKVVGKGQKKLGKVITPDPWKSGARNTTESGGRVVNENKALTSKKNRFTPYQTFTKCRICKSSVHQSGSHYCQGCAYKKGICAMCGKKIIETKNYRQTSV